MYNNVTLICTDDATVTPVHISSPADLPGAARGLCLGVHRLTGSGARYAEIEVRGHDEDEPVSLILHDDDARNRAILLRPIGHPSWCELHDAGRLPASAAQWHPLHALTLAHRWVTDASWDASDHTDQAALRPLAYDEEPTVVRYWDTSRGSDPDLIDTVGEVLLIALRGALNSGLTVDDVLTVDEELPLLGPARHLARRLDRAHDEMHRDLRSQTGTEDALVNAEHRIESVLTEADVHPAGPLYAELHPLAVRYATCGAHPDLDDPDQRQKLAFIAARESLPHADLDD